MTDLITDARRIWCAQHLQERDAHQLKEMGANQKNRDRILADIYGSQRSIFVWRVDYSILMTKLTLM